MTTHVVAVPPQHLQVLKLSTMEVSEDLDAIFAALENVAPSQRVQRNHMMKRRKKQLHEAIDERMETAEQRQRPAKRVKLLNKLDRERQLWKKNDSTVHSLRAHFLNIRKEVIEKREQINRTKRELKQAQVERKKLTDELAVMTNEYSHSKDLTAAQRSEYQKSVLALRNALEAEKAEMAKDHQQLQDWKAAQQKVDAAEQAKHEAETRLASASAKLSALMEYCTKLGIAQEVQLVVDSAKPEPAAQQSAVVSSAASSSSAAPAASGTVGVVKSVSVGSASTAAAADAGAVDVEMKAVDAASATSAVTDAAAATASSTATASTPASSASSTSSSAAAPASSAAAAVLSSSSSSVSSSASSSSSSSSSSSPPSSTSSLASDLAVAGIKAKLEELGGGSLSLHQYVLTFLSKYAKQLEEHSQARHKAEVRVAQLQRELQSQERQQKDKSEQLEAQKLRIAELITASSKGDEKAKQLEEELKEEKDKLKEAQAEKEHVQKLLAAQQRLLDDKNKSISVAEECAMETTRNMVQVTSELKILRTGREILLSQYERVRKELAQHDQEVSAAKEEAAKAELVARKAEQSVVHWKKQYNRALSKSSEQAEELSALRAQVRALTSCVEDLSGADKKRSAALEDINEQLANGALKRVAELLAEVDK